MQAIPGAGVTAVPTLFDAIAELSSNRFTTVLAAAEPLERRPEAAVRTLRELAGDARLLLFGHPTLEILSQKMLQFGCDDYVITPAAATEFAQIFASPLMRLADDTIQQSTESQPQSAPRRHRRPRAPSPRRGVARCPPVQPPRSPHCRGQPDQRPYRPRSRAPPHQARRISPPVPQGQTLVSNPVRNGPDEVGTLHLILPAAPATVLHDESIARHTLAQVSQLMGKVAALQDRHNKMQKLAITDELTGSYNARYFRHFLASIIERARKLHFPVTLLLFDIDDFKKYNDQFGHATGDEILKQAAALMKRCTRQHDLVARIGGDEFAVVFWDKEGPRQPRDPKPGVSSRPPQEPLQVFERFKRLMSSEEFPLLGQTGKGSLTVSAGLAVFPWDATDADTLIREADKRLMMGAKKNGKNAIYIVGADDPQ